MNYEDFLAEDGFAEVFASVYTGRHEPLDALWWLSHPADAGPSGTESPEAPRRALQIAAYSRDGNADAERALAGLERQLAEDRAATLAAIERVRHPEYAAGEVAEEAPRSSRRRLVPILVGAVALVVAIVLAVQLAAPNGTPAASPTIAAASPSPSATIAPQPTATASFVDYSGPASCVNVLDVSTTNRFAGRGLHDISAALRQSDIQPDFPVFDFAAAGGLVCAWSDAADGSNVTALYAYAPLDATSAQREEGFLAGNGYAKSSTKLATIYERDGDSYAFGDGFWAYSMTGDYDVLNDVVVRAPENADKPRTDLQSAVYVTSEGIGDLRIGSPVPSRSTLVSWDPTACGGGDAGAYVPKSPFTFGSSDAPASFLVVTEKRARSGDLRSILILSPDIPTKSGIRVGDSEAKLRKTFPEFAHGDNYTLTGTIGKIRFELASTDPDHPSDQVVVAIFVVPIGSEFPAMNSDGEGPCVA